MHVTIDNHGTLTPARISAEQRAEYITAGATIYTSRAGTTIVIRGSNHDRAWRQALEA